MMSKAVRVILIILLVLVVGVGGFAWYTFAQLQKGAVATAQAPEDFWDETEVDESAQAPMEAPATATPFDNGETEIVGISSVTPTPMPIYETDEKDNAVYNILLVGTDSRTTSATEVEGRSDTMMVASYNVKANTLTLISFMRDSYVTRLGEKSKFKGKLNAAYSNGGVGELINTLNYNFDLGLQEYVSVGFAGFWVLIDGFYGVDINMTAEEAYRVNWRCAGLLKNDDKRNYKQMLIDQGKGDYILDDDYEGSKVQTIHGEQALWYCRDRYTEFTTEDGEKLGGDEARIARQQYVIKTLYKRILSSEFTFQELWSMYQYASQWMSTNISMETLLDLGSKMMNNDPVIQYVRVPETVEIGMTEPDPETGIATEYVKMDVKKEKARLDALLYGGTATPTPAAD